MNWLTNFIRPKIRSIVDQKDVPDNFWQKCPSCEGMLFHRDFKDNLNVCYHCGHHMKILVSDRLALMYDDGQFKELPMPKVSHDPLKFKDLKKYNDRLRDTRTKTGREDAIMVASGTIDGIKVVTAAMDFRFMGGSMGAAVGEAIVAAAERAVKDKAALIVIPTSGGARMQEGMISLMQMPRSIIAAEMVKNAGLPYLVVLTDPTTGGVSASFAMVGDIHIAEPGATIGFAGKRVIQETIREELPENFQTAEYLLEHGMVDMVVPRAEMRETLVRILDLLMNTEKKSGGKKRAGLTKKGTKTTAKAKSAENSSSAPASRAEAPKSAEKKAKAVRDAAAKITAEQAVAPDLGENKTPKKATARKA